MLESQRSQIERRRQAKKQIVEERGSDKSNVVVYRGRDADTGHDLVERDGDIIQVLVTGNAQPVRGMTLTLLDGRRGELPLVLGPSIVERDRRLLTIPAPIGLVAFVLFTKGGSPNRRMRFRYSSQPLSNEWVNVVSPSGAISSNPFGSVQSFDIDVSGLSYVSRGILGTPTINGIGLEVQYLIDGVYLNNEATEIIVSGFFQLDQDVNMPSSAGGTISATLGEITLTEQLDNEVLSLQKAYRFELTPPPEGFNELRIAVSLTSSADPPSDPVNSANWQFSAVILDFPAQQDRELWLGGSGAAQLLKSFDPSFDAFETGVPVNVTSTLGASDPFPEFGLVSSSDGSIPHSVVQTASHSSSGETATQTTNFSISNSILTLTTSLAGSGGDFWLVNSDVTVTATDFALPPGDYVYEATGSLTASFNGGTSGIGRNNYFVRLGPRTGVFTTAYTPFRPEANALYWSDVSGAFGRSVFATEGQREGSFNVPVFRANNNLIFSVIWRQGLVQPGATSSLSVEFEARIIGDQETYLVTLSGKEIVFLKYNNQASYFVLPVETQYVDPSTITTDPDDWRASRATFGTPASDPNPCNEDNKDNPLVNLSNDERYEIDLGQDINGVALDRRLVAGESVSEAEVTVQSAVVDESTCTLDSPTTEKVKLSPIVSATEELPISIRAVSVHRK